MFRTFANIPQKRNDRELVVSEDNVPAGVELEEEAVGAIGECDFDDAICADLRYSGDSASLEKLPQACNKGRWRSGGSTCETGKVAAEARINEHLLAVFWFGEFEEEYAL